MSILSFQPILDYRAQTFRSTAERRISTKEWGEARDYAQTRGLTRLDGEA